MSTSKLQRFFGNMLDEKLPEFKIKENVRPNWLISSDKTWLELDFYIEEIKIAFEVQGEQHYKFVPFFHKSEQDFEKRKKHDQEKRDLCYGKGIRLIEILTETDAQIAIHDIRKKYCTQPKYFYQDDSKNEIIPKKKSNHKKAMERMVNALSRKFKNANHINAKLDIAARAIRASFIHKVIIPEEIQVFISLYEKDVEKRVGPVDK